MAPPPPSADAIAQVVLDRFALLPPKRKPRIRPNGVHEWVPLAGIVMEQQQQQQTEGGADGGGSLTCLALGTGMKCLPADKLVQTRGHALHDWHAEVVAIRALNRFLLEECRSAALTEGGGESTILRRRTRLEREREEGGEEGAGGAGTECWRGQPFALRDHIRLYMYCSEAPCGDASMELTMASQVDATPWVPPPPAPPPPAPPTPPPPHRVSLPGRGYFSQLGIVRRKPSRPDAPLSLSKSCSDKLALKQFTSLLSSVTAIIIAPNRSAYLQALVIPRRQVCAAACERCFSIERGRMAGFGLDGGAVTAGGGGGGGGEEEEGEEEEERKEKAEKEKEAGGGDGGYGFVPLAVLGTDVEFAYSRARARARAPPEAGTAAFGGALAWHDRGLEESLEAGILRGGRGPEPRWASGLSRQGMWTLAIQVADMLGPDHGAIQSRLRRDTYRELKRSGLLLARRRVKAEVRREALAGWIENDGDSDFGPELPANVPA